MNLDYLAERSIAAWNNMVFKNFRLQVIARVLLLTAAILILAWCLAYGYGLRSVYAAVGVVIIVIEFIWYVDRFNRDVNSYLVSLMQHDFTTHFQSKGRSRSFDELYETLNRIAEVFKTITAEKEAQFRFLEMLVEHLRVGILTIDESERIILANQALKELLQKDILFSLKTLESLSPVLASTLREIRSGETRLLKLQLKNELLQLSVHASEFRVENNYHKLVSMQNIRHELDAKEMEAWHKLIRVLTHEIMNSVSPIISLSETMHKLVGDNTQTINDGNALYDTLHKGLDAIKVRSEGLYNFTQSYRKLTGVPKITLKQANTREIIDRVAVLMENNVKARGITLKKSAPDIPVSVDPELMEQVLINLVLNAIDALSETSAGVIELRASRNTRGEVLIIVRDNGEGIDEVSADKIFIPFFTTRKTGSGIGLALAKQILQLHNADISFTTEKNKGTEFVIRL